MNLLLDSRTKGNRVILSFQRWIKVRVLLEIEHVRVHESIKISEHAQLKDIMKYLVPKKRDETEDELDAKTLDELILETTNDVRTCSDIRMLDFGEELSSNSDEGR